MGRLGMVWIVLKRFVSVWDRLGTVWSVFRPKLHSITSIRGVAFDTKTTPRIDVIGCRFVHPVTYISGVFFVQIYILLRLFVHVFCSKVRPIMSIRVLVLDLKQTTQGVDVIHGKLNPICMQHNIYVA